MLTCYNTNKIASIIGRGLQFGLLVHRLKGLKGYTFYSVNDLPLILHKHLLYGSKEYQRPKLKVAHRERLNLDPEYNPA